jgi:hypothetical protein
MRDEQLREGLAAWLRPTVQAPAPDVSVIRRRLRRRRAGMAVAGTVVCVLGAGAAALIHVTAPPAATMEGHGLASAPPCRGGQLRVARLAALVETSGVSMDPLPDTFLLQIRNAGPVACSVEGWPRLAIAAPRAMRAVPISDSTVSTMATRRGSVSRVVRPTRVVLAPGAMAAATITVTFPLDEVGCANAVWSVTPPRGSTATPVRRARASAPHRQIPLLLCRSSTVVVSPVYPADVPVGQNYLPAAPGLSPASVSTSPPMAGAGPQAAPYFVTLDGFRGNKAVVYNWRTGKVTAVIRAPGAASGFTGVAAAGDDRTFVLAAGNTVSRFYQLILSQDGTPDKPLIPLPVPPVHVNTVNGPFAVSDDGSELAMSLSQPGKGTAGQIMVVSLVTGSVRTWRAPDPGTVQGLSWADPGSSPATSWAGNDRLLFGWTDASPDRRVARERSGLRLLDPGAPGTDLLASRLLIPASVRVGALATLTNPLISADGTVVFATMTAHAGTTNVQAAVVEFSAATGHPLGVVTPLADESGMGTWCGALWVNPSGSHALVTCGVQGEVSNGHFTPADLHYPAHNFSADGISAW